MKIMPPSRTSGVILILLFALAAYSTPASAGNINTTIVTDTVRTLPLPSSQGMVSGISGGGGTGGGGIITDEPWSNILKFESIEKSLISGKPVRYSFSRHPDMPVYEIDLTGRENENYVTVKVELLKGLSPKIKKGPEGTVYRYVNIYAGTQRIQEARIRFRVPNEWLADNSIAGITLTRWNRSAGVWEKLETNRTGEDNTNTFYESTAPSLSNFAITGVPPPPPSPAEPVQPETPSSTASPAPGTTTPGFEGIAAVLLLLLIARRRKHRYHKNQSGLYG